MYDKRFEVYRITREFIASFGLESTRPVDQSLKALRSVMDYDFLFGKNIKNHLDELSKRGIEFQTISRNIEEMYSNDKGRDQQLQKLKSISLWFSEQVDPSKKLFEKYLKITKR